MNYNPIIPSCMITVFAAGIGGDVRMLCRSASARSAQMF